ncbi:uncharacterized protein V1510DRAFT_401490 [Dipodascopsis tothii]|uniref:uncharacterized protein n=1 Tax=Dipodascopsis tothii TaxID=44089 RepID=UPI0034CE4D19
MGAPPQNFSEAVYRRTFPFRALAAAGGLTIVAIYAHDMAVPQDGGGDMLYRPQSTMRKGLSLVLALLSALFSAHYLVPQAQPSRTWPADVLFMGAYVVNVAIGGVRIPAGCRRNRYCTKEQIALWLALVNAVYWFMSAILGYSLYLRRVHAPPPDAAAAYEADGGLQRPPAAAVGAVLSEDPCVCVADRRGRPAADDEKAGLAAPPPAAWNGRLRTRTRGHCVTR